jgi:hypothetical protein
MHNTWREFRKYRNVNLWRICDSFIENIYLPIGPASKNHNEQSNGPIKISSRHRLSSCSLLLGIHILLEKRTSGAIRTFPPGRQTFVMWYFFELIEQSTCKTVLSFLLLFFVTAILASLDVTIDEKRKHWGVAPWVLYCISLKFLAQRGFFYSRVFRMWKGFSLFSSSLFLISSFLFSGVGRVTSQW